MRTGCLREGPSVAYVDLNSDLGESFGQYKIGEDEEMMKIISSANVACGFHGGDPQVMHETLSQARANGVGVGAHPGFNDLWGFGRRRIVGDSPADIEKSLVYQIGAIQGMATSLDMRVTHYKIHGALSNMACEDEDLAMAAARAVKSVDQDLIFLVLPGSERHDERYGRARRQLQPQSAQLRLVRRLRLGDVQSARCVQRVRI